MSEISKESGKDEEKANEKKKISCNFFMLFISNTCFMGCAEDRKPSQISDSDKAEEVPEKETEETAETKPERREIPIDFPFYGEQEGDRLVLAAPEEGQDAYELIHYDKDGSILQQIDCGKLQEPVTFSYDGLAYGSQNDLQIFPEGGDTGLLFIRKDGLFVAASVVIPRYEEIWDNGMLVVKEDEKLCEKIIYLLNEDKNRIEEARRYELQKDTGTLTIRDEKEYSHHDLVFGSTLCSLDSFYDTHERVIYERGYITHGHLEYYYLYEDRDGKIAEKPAYILEIDYNLNYAIPNMIKCR